MMDRVYAVGVIVIEFIQDWFQDWENYFVLVNNFADPHHVFQVFVPLVSILDSVFASQLLLCMSFGSWLNSCMKWWLLEDRPYWWVQETAFYSQSMRPKLRQYNQTCETGPGCPSGHSSTIAMLLILAIMWISHILNDRKLSIWWWKYLVYPVFVFMMASVILARLFIATHFPHQCLFGALVGLFIAPALCIYVSDPYIWRYGLYINTSARTTVFWHVMSTIVTIAIAGITYLSLVVCGWDPLWTVQLAYRWCENPDSIQVSTTPLFALVQSTGSLLGWSLCVTPAVTEYRHYTKNRSLVISAVATSFMMYAITQLQHSINKKNMVLFYVVEFVLHTLTPIVLLRGIPTLAVWPYRGADIKSKTD